MSLNATNGGGDDFTLRPASPFPLLRKLTRISSTETRFKYINTSRRPCRQRLHRLRGLPVRKILRHSSPAADSPIIKASCVVVLGVASHSLAPIYPPCRSSNASRNGIKCIFWNSMKAFRGCIDLPPLVCECSNERGSIETENSLPPAGFRFGGWLAAASPIIRVQHILINLDVSCFCTN